MAARALIAAAGLLAAANGWSAESGREQLREFLDGLQTLRADFEQTLVDASGGEGERSSGSLAIRRPGLFRWDYREPYPQEIVADGQTIWIYDPDLAQVTREDQDRALDGSPAQVLSDTVPLEASFRVGPGEEDAAGLAWVTLVPREESSQFEEIRLGFRDDTLVRMEMADKLGQSSVFRFSNVRRNPDIAGSVFRFQPPPGADVLQR
jgi:outer membrane lipoprotein carrier protein